MQAKKIARPWCRTTQNSHINFQEHRYLQKFDYLLAVKTSSRSIIERCTTFLRATNCINNFAIAEYLTVTTRALLQFIDEKKSEVRHRPPGHRSPSEIRQMFNVTRIRSVVHQPIYKKKNSRPSIFGRRSMCVSRLLRKFQMRKCRPTEDRHNCLSIVGR